jgi:hypothetical protein
MSKYTEFRMTYSRFASAIDVYLFVTGAYVFATNDTVVISSRIAVISPFQFKVQMLAFRGINPLFPLHP